MLVPLNPHQGMYQVPCNVLLAWCTVLGCPKAAKPKSSWPLLPSTRNGAWSICFKYINQDGLSVCWGTLHLHVTVTGPRERGKVSRCSSSNRLARRLDNVPLTAPWSSVLKKKVFSRGFLVTVSVIELKISFLLSRTIAHALWAYNKLVLTAAVLIFDIYCKKCCFVV